MCIQEEARKANTKEVAEEDRKAKLPKNYAAKRAQAEWEEAEEKARKVTMRSVNSAWVRKGSLRIVICCCNQPGSGRSWTGL